MEKVVLATKNGSKGQKKLKLDKGSKKGERDVELDITSGTNDDIFIAEKLDVEKLEKTFNGQDIVWFNNFQIKKQTSDGPVVINQSYLVKIVGLKAWKNEGRKIIIQDGNANEGKPYEFMGKVNDDDTIELTDGDPGVGGSPPKE